MPVLYLIPSVLDEEGYDHVPGIVIEIMKDLDIFITERVRTTRRYIRRTIPEFDIDQATFIELDKHEKGWSDFMSAFKKGKDIGLLSEAGLPCLADPGSEVVRCARSMSYIIKPLTGPSSVFLGLIASGFNGQSFTFHGYLPIKEKQLKTRLEEIERDFRRSDYTQIWIETPYRSNSMLHHICSFIDENIDLCVCQNLTGPKEIIRTMAIARWRKEKISKEPTIFILGR